MEDAKRYVIWVLSEVLQRIRQLLHCLGLTEQRLLCRSALQHLPGL